MIRSLPLHGASVWGCRLALVLVPLATSSCDLVSTNSPFWATVTQGIAEKSRVPVTREYVDRLPYASALAWFEDAPIAFIVLSKAEGGRLYWQTSDRKIIVTQGHMVVQTAGLDSDLSAVNFGNGSSPDVLEATASDATRRLDVVSVRVFDMPVRSRFQNMGMTKIKILGTEHDVIHVREEAVAAGFPPFVNDYYVDPTTRQLRKLRQVLIPGQPAFNMEITRPFAS